MTVKFILHGEDKDGRIYLSTLGGKATAAFDPQAEDTRSEVPPQD